MKLNYYLGIVGVVFMALFYINNEMAYLYLGSTFLLAQIIIWIRKRKSLTNIEVKPKPKKEKIEDEEKKEGEEDDKKEKTEEKKE